MSGTKRGSGKPPRPSRANLPAIISMPPVEVDPTWLLLESLRPTGRRVSIRPALGDDDELIEVQAEWLERYGPPTLPPQDRERAPSSPRRAPPSLPPYAKVQKGAKLRPPPLPRDEPLQDEPAPPPRRSRRPAKKG